MTSSHAGMRVHLGTDHAGYELKEHLLAWLTKNGYEAVDHGPSEFDPDDDYPPFVIQAAEAVASDPGSRGVVIGGSGNGEQIAANKVSGIRAALAWNEETAALARQHNDANIVSIGARMHTQDEATALVARFLATPFSHDQRHIRRLQQIAEYEATSGPLPYRPQSTSS